MLRAAAPAVVFCRSLFPHRQGLERAPARVAPARRQTLVEARWIALGGVLLLAAAFAHEALRGGREGRALVWVGLGLALLASAPLARHELADESSRVFVISERGIALRSEPRADAQVLEHVESGTYRRELNRLSGWVGVRTTSGAKGWVPESGVLVLPSTP